MAIPIIQVPDPTGTKCCDCATQSGCGCGAGCSIKCRSSAGTAVFCGFPEFPGHTSNPPLYYRTANLSGGVTATCSTDGEGCTNPDQCSQSWTYGGQCSFDRLTCAETTTGNLVITGTCAAGGTFPTCDIQATSVDNVSGVSVTFPDVYTSTSHEFSSPDAGTCFNSASGFTGCIWQISTCECILSTQDTIADAILRETGPDVVWSSQSQGACGANSSFTTTWSSPSKTFGFRLAQVQLTIPFTTPGHTYSFKIILGERATGSIGPFTPFGLIEGTVDSTSLGCVTPWIDIPMEGGIEIAPESCTAVQTS
jgi:hypothetical protein